MKKKNQFLISFLKETLIGAGILECRKLLGVLHVQMCFGYAYLVRSRAVFLELFWVSAETPGWLLSLYVFSCSLQGPRPVGFLSVGREQVVSEPAVQGCSRANESVEKDSREFRLLCISLLFGSPSGCCWYDLVRYGEKRGWCRGLPSSSLGTGAWLGFFCHGAPREHVQAFRCTMGLQVGPPWAFPSAQKQQFITEPCRIKAALVARSLGPSDAWAPSSGSWWVDTGPQGAAPSLQLYFKKAGDGACRAKEELSLSPFSFSLTRRGRVFCSPSSSGLSTVMHRLSKVMVQGWGHLGSDSLRGVLNCPRISFLSSTEGKSLLRPSPLLIKGLSGFSVTKESTSFLPHLSNEEVKLRLTILASPLTRPSTSASFHPWMEYWEGLFLNPQGLAWEVSQLVTLNQELWFIAGTFVQGFCCFPYGDKHSGGLETANRRCQKDELPVCSAEEPRRGGSFQGAIDRPV